MQHEAQAGNTVANRGDVLPATHQRNQPIDILYVTFCHKNLPKHKGIKLRAENITPGDDIIVGTFPFLAWITLLRCRCAYFVPSVTLIRFSDRLPYSLFFNRKSLR
jgi:hypothetical protein